jgi:hypothetical protein
MHLRSHYIIDAATGDSLRALLRPGQLFFKKYRRGSVSNYILVGWLFYLY